MKETITINGKEYVRKDEVQAEVINFTGEETIASVMIGKKVIVRSRNAGIIAGIVELADNTGIILRDARRIYYHRPLDQKLSWYEGVAVSGLSDDSKISGTVLRKVIIEDYEINECTDIAFESIMAKTPNEQS